jgi:hypothetical protein
LTGEWVDFDPKFSHMNLEFAKGALEMFNSLSGRTDVGYVVWQDFDSLSKSCHARSFAELDEAVEYRCQLIDMVVGLLRNTDFEATARQNFTREFEMWTWFRAADSIKSGTATTIEAAAILADAAVRMEKFSEI